ncbi:MAG: HAD family phosphatase [Anaerolineales bacterium]|jgi:epoxide hydrolase-like predicted phosphatase
MTIHAILWDIGGVLERTEDLTPRQKVAERLGIKIPDLIHLFFGHTDDFRVQLGEITPEEHWENVRRQLDLGESEMTAVRNDFFAGDRLDMDLIDFIRELKHEYCTAVVSNYMSGLRDRIMNEWDIGDAFHHLIISAEVGMMKPQPEIYQFALETLGFAPEETVFIDDFTENVEGAQAVGIHGILFTSPEQVRIELSKLLQKKYRTNELCP